MNTIPYPNPPKLTVRIMKKLDGTFHAWAEGHEDWIARGATLKECLAAMDDVLEIIRKSTPPGKVPQ